MRHIPSLTLLLALAACGGGVGVFNPAPGGPQLQGSCVGGPDVLMETDEQAYLQLGGAFDQLRHDEGPGADPIKMTTKIDTWIRTYMCQNRVPGVALGVIWHGNIVYIKGYGLGRGWETATEADDMPVRGQRTRFRWASVSKCVTGVAAVMATQETDENLEPLFDLDANLAVNYRCTNEFCAYVLPDSWYPAWFEDMEEEDWPIDSELIPDVEETYDFTPRRLLSHYGGVMHYGDGDPAGGVGYPSTQETIDHPGFIWALSKWNTKPLVDLPGTTWIYSSYGMNMAGAALNMAVPGGFWNYVKTRIANQTEPTAMQYFHPDDVYDPQYAVAPWWTADDRAHGYRKNDEAEVVPNYTPHDVSWKLPGGGFISTCADLVLFANGLLHNHFLDEAATEELWRPQAFAVKGLPGAPSGGYALGFSVGQMSGERLVAHNGSQEDAKSRLMLFPDGEDPRVGELAIVVMSNAEYCSPSAIANQVNTLLRNPYVEEGAVVFEGTLPRNLQWAEQDAVARVAVENGPYVYDGDYREPQRDYLSETRPPAFRILLHEFNPDYRTAPPVDSPDRIPDEDDRVNRESEDPGRREDPPREPEDPKDRED